MTTHDSERFHHLAPMKASDFANIQAGKMVSLLMLHHVPTGGGVLFQVEFIPGELMYRTAGQKDAVLHGTARLVDGGSDFEQARILFSQYHQTATLKGLTLEGGVKFA